MGVAPEAMVGYFLVDNRLKDFFNFLLIDLFYTNTYSLDKNMMLVT
jgi:hypothetical protein